MVWMMVILGVTPSGPLRDPGKAVWWSLVPGGGQFYTGQPVKGVILGGAEGFFLLQTLRHAFRAYTELQSFRTSGDPAHREAFLQAQQTMLFHLFWYLTFWGYAAADAYVAAHLFALDERLHEVRRALGIQVHVSF